METKSRYEVISDLEVQKRELIRERDGFDDAIKVKERGVKDVERQKGDQIVAWDRKLEDLNEELTTLKETVEERKSTIKELIISINDSLARFGKLAKPDK